MYCPRQAFGAGAGQRLQKASDGMMMEAKTLVPARRTCVIGIDATEVPDGLSVIDLRPASVRPRPAPEFLYGPVEPDSLRHFHNDQFEPPASVFCLRDVEVLGPWFGTGVLLVRGDIDFSCHGIALNPRSEEARARLADHLAARSSGARIARRIPGQALLLANNGHQIYGHWLVDFLPKLYLLERAGLDIDQISIMLPSDIGGFGAEFLRVLGVRDERIIRYDPDCESLFPDELVVPTTLRWGGRCSPLFADAVAYLNERIDRCNRLPVSQARRLFLSRGQSGRNARPFVNEDRVEQLAVEAGLTLVHPERLPLLEQIALFRGARRVVGQYGSALHATIFGRPGVVVCGLHGQLPASFDALQSGIGERLGQPTGYVFADPVPAGADAWAISVDEAAFAACLSAEFAA